MPAEPVQITLAERRVITALAGALIDPGELTRRELIIRVRPTPPDVIIRVARLLEEKGLVDVEDREDPYGLITLTRAGADVVDALGIHWAVRT